MWTIYAPCDGPTPVIEGQVIRDDLRIVGAPTYGRVLFRWPTAVIRDNLFIPQTHGLEGNRWGRA